MKTLNQEKFSTLKELADLQTSIAFGRSELEKLKLTTDEYLVVREKEAEDRVIKVLKKSREALEATTNNHKELSAYNRDIRAYSIELTGLSTDISTLFQDFNERMEVADGDMENHKKQVSEILKVIKIEKVNIQEDRKLLQGERAEIRDSWRLLKDRQQTLKKGFEELKKLQANR